MPEFQTAVDIGNRALQRVGAQMMDPNLGFADGSNNANQVSFCYGKLRRAELMRNVWTFATREAALRPIDTNTMLLAPTLWDPVVTYFVASVVADQAGTLWKSIIRDNLGNDPQNSPFAWVPYFGPMTAEPFDSSKGYYAGELIYTLSGAGTYRVYASKLNGNSVHPGLPNQWAANTIYNTDDVVQIWPAWLVGATYSQGQTVQYTDGNIYSSLVNGNVGNIPPATGSKWALMPVLTLQSQLMPTNLFVSPQPIITTPVDEWQIATNYSTGTFVMYIGQQYVAIASNNTGNYPNVVGSTFWAQCTGGTVYQSLIDLNQDNNPANAPPLWVVGTSYSSANQVIASNGVIYTSQINGNVGNNPVIDSGVNWLNTRVLGPWTTQFVLGGGNQLWIMIGGSDFPNGVGLTKFQLTYPLGSGPLSQSWTKNAYRLPANYLRKAPQDPTAGSFSWLGFPGNLVATDWTIEGDFMTTWDSTAIVYRFVADMQDVSKFPDMFCEALACRVALEVCEPITQSSAKLQVIGQEYKKFMGEAIVQNAIEIGPIQPPMDDLIACRY